MKSLISLAVAAIAFSITALPAVEAQSVQRTAAIVNNVVISTFDLDQRVRMILSTSGGASGAAAQQRLREQVLRTLIDEILQLTAAQKADINITQADIAESLQKIAQQNNTTPEKILGSLAAAEP